MILKVCDGRGIPEVIVMSTLPDYSSGGIMSIIAKHTLARGTIKKLSMLIIGECVISLHNPTRKLYEMVYVKGIEYGTLEELVTKYCATLEVVHE